VANAAIPDSSNVIHACYHPQSNGSNTPLGVIDTAKTNGTCPNGDTTLTWNQTGPQGPAGATGATGAAGATGATGPAGPPGSPAPLTTTTVTYTNPLGFPAGNTADVTCPAGTTVTGGGYDAGNVPGTAVAASKPDGSNGWYAFQSGGPSGEQLTVYAICASS
jgi:hypothetical protein